MAESIITQVKNPSDQTTSLSTSDPAIHTVPSPRRKKNFLARLFRCFSSNSDGPYNSHFYSTSEASSKAASPNASRVVLPTSSTSHDPFSSKKTGNIGKGSHQKYLLKPLASEDNGKKCLVLDLDETLVHSSFKAVPNADFIIPVEIDGQVHSVYVLKRPGVDTFLEKLGPQFETVVFTASLSKYADPVMDALDKSKVVKHRLFRESCIHHRGNYVKDLSLLGRDLKNVIIIDNAPASYMFHPSNAIPITSWFNDPSDTELLDLIPFLEDLKMVDDVTTVLDHTND